MEDYIYLISSSTYRTIGEAHKETKELEREGFLNFFLRQLIKNQERKLGIKHLGFPKLMINTTYRGLYKNGKIYIKYWDEKYLNHELGHFYLDKLSVKLFGSDLLKNPSGPAKEWWVGRNRLISEGISMYFEVEMGVGEKKDFNDSEYPTKADEFIRNKAGFLFRLIYDGGYHLINPILDKFGVEEGCKYILSDLPKKKDMSNLPGYRDKLLNKN